MKSLESHDNKKLSYPANTSALLLPDLIPSDSDDESYAPSNSSSSENESSSDSDLDSATEAPDELIMGQVQASYLVDWLSIQMYQLDHRQAKLKQAQRILANLFIFFGILMTFYCILFKRIPWQLKMSLFLRDIRMIQTWFTYIVINIASKVQGVFGSLHYSIL